MKQRVVVQAIIQTDGKVLVLRRSQGRPSIVGKFELPGGTLDTGEQPEDALKRHIYNSTSLVARVVHSVDIVSMTNREEGDIQHILVSYDVTGIRLDEPVKLGSSYDQFQWLQLSEIQQKDLRDSAKLLLEMYVSSGPVPFDSAVVTSGDVKKTSKIPTALIYSDGGSRGNPGPSAAAFVIIGSDQTLLDQGGAYLGITTNNQAEYHGVQLGLECAVALGLKTIEFRVDSMLVVNQLKGVYKIKNRELWPINERVRQLISQFDKVTFVHVPREFNQQADLLVNKLLDEHQNEPALV